MGIDSSIENLIENTKSFRRDDSCFSIEDSKICKGIGSAYVKPVSNFSNINEFDDYMTKYVDTNKYYIDGFKDTYGCDGFKGESLRYHVSTLCYYMAENSGCSQPSNYTSYCKTSCSNYMDSVTSVFNDTDVCPTTNVESSLLTNRNSFSSGDYAKYCNDIPNQVGGCSKAVEYDLDLCGFVKENSARSFCSINNTTDSCCNRFYSKYGETASNSNKNKIIIGVVVGLIVFFILLILGFILYRRHKNKQYARDSDSYYGNTSSEHLTRNPTMGNFEQHKADYEKSMDMNYGEKSMQYTGNQADNSYARGLTGPRNPNTLSMMQQPNVVQSYNGGQQMNVMSMYSNPANDVYRQGSQNSNTSNEPSRQGTNGSLGSNRILSPGMMSSANMSGNMQQIAEGNSSLIQMKCIEAYNPVLDDEVRLAPGDIITIDEQFDDGWAVGRNESTGEIGAFPVACLVTFNDYDNMINEGSLNFSTGRNSTYSARTKSLSKM